MPDNVDKLFEIMQANGAANDRNKFRKVFLTPGNKGYKIRKDIYDGLRADGIIDSPTYEDFRRKLRLGGTPTVNKYRQQMFNSVDPNKSRASELTHRAVSQAKRAMNNVRKPVTAKVVDKKGKPTGEEFAITPAKTIEDLDREYAQETTKNWENELHAQMADADKDAAKISDMFKSFIGSTDEVGSVWGNMARGGGIAGTPHSVTTNNGILENTKARQLLAARDYNRKRKELLQLEQDSRNGAIFDNHSFFRGMYDAAKDTGFLTGGASDLINAGSLLATKQDLDNGIHTEAGDMLMQQAVKNSDAQSQYGDNKGWMYTGGVITTNMAPFMVQIGSAGFSKGMSNAIGKVVQGAASKVALGTMEKATGMAGAHIANYIGKVTGLTTKAFGKAIQYGIVGAAQANTVGLGNVANDVINRYTGQVYQDEQGNYKFGTFDSDGKLVHEGGEDFLTALVKGEAAQTIEFATELAGGGIDAAGTALKNFVTKGGKKIINKYNMENVSKVIDFLLNNKVSKNARYLKAGADRTLGKVELNSIVGESLEEELGIIANTVFTGDNKISDLWDEKQQSQIWGGMLLSIGLMKGAVAPFHAYNAKQYYTYKHKLDKADVNLSQLLGKEKWEELRNQIDATTNEDMPEMVNRINRDVALGKNRQPVREYIQNLLIMRGYDIGNMLAAKKAVEDKGEGVSVKNMEKNQAYQQGRDAYGYDTHEIQLDQEDKQKSLAQLLGISEQQLASMSDEELESFSGRDDNIDRAIYDYQLSSARYEGVVDNARDQIDLEVQRAAQAVDMYTDKSRNTIRNATIKASGGLEDYGVYIISGNIATHDDGSIDVSNSDDMILYYDPTTNTVEHADAMMFAELGSEENADEVRSQAMADAKEKAIKETTGIIDGVVEVGTQFKTVDADGTEHTYEVLADNGDGTAVITIDGNIPTELVKGENVNIPVSFEELQKMKDESDQQRLQAAKAQREQMENERAEQQMQAQTTQAENPAQENNIQSAPIEDNIDYSDIIRKDGKVQMVDVSDKDGNNLFPDAKDVFYIQGNKMRTKFVYIDANGELKTQSFPTGLVKIKTRGEVSVDDYKKYRNTLLSAESSAIPESSMIEDNSGTIEANRGGIEVEDNTQPLSEADADNVIAQMESSAETAPDLELTPDNWTAEFGEDGILSTPIGDVKMGENQVAKLFEKGRSKEFGMIKPTLTNPDVIIEVPSHSADGNEERSSSYLFIKTFLGKNGKKVYYFKSVTIKKDGLEISISSHYDRAKRVKEALMKGKLLYRKNDGAQTKQNQPSTSVTTSQEDAAGSSESKDTNISANDNENNESLTFEDGTPIPVDESGETDLSQTDAAHAAEWYDNNLGEDADDWLDGEIKKAKKVLEQAKNKKLAGTKPSELVVSKKEKEAAIADAQAHYDSAISIRDSLKERRIAKEENTAEGRKNLIEKARRKFARLKSSVKDDGEAVAQIYKETVGSLLHRLYDGTGIDVTDTIPLTAEEYVASNLSAHSLNYEGTETSKGVKQETGLSREDFAKTQLLAADGKGTTIDNLVHSLWENRPSNLDTLDTQDIRNALIGVLTSGFKASEARSFIENIRIAQAEKLIEEERTAAENAAYYEQQKAKEEEEKKKAEENIDLPAIDKQGEPINNNIIELAKWAKKQGLEIDPTSKLNSYADLFLMCKDGFGVSTLVPDEGKNINQVIYFPDNAEVVEQLGKLQVEFNAGRDLNHSSNIDSEITEGATFYDAATAKEFRDFANEQTKFPDTLREGSNAIEAPEDATDENPLGLQLSKDKVPFEIEGGKSGETYNINDDEDRQRLINDNKVDDKDILDIDMPKHVHKAIKELCKKMGLKVQFLYMGARSNGWIENGTMYLALDTEKATQFVFGHEMTHAIKQKNPEAYKELVKVAMAVTTKKKFEEDLAKVYQNYHGISGYNNVDDYVEEVVADNLGKFINDFDLAQKFSLRLNHPILGTILHAIQKIKSLLYGDFYKSVDALERIVEKAYVETAKGQVTNSETGEDVSFSLRLKSAIEETETNPSDAQKESGNYKKGHIKFGGYDYTIENPKGSTRSGKDANGKEWKVTMHDTYGYIRGKFGKDGDHLDMFINDKADLDNWNGDVFVVDQVNPDGSFDEHKVMYGYDSMDDAKKSYLANYSDGWQGLGNITGASKDEFDKWLDTSNRKLKPFADYAKVKFSQAQSVAEPHFSLDDIKPVGVGAFGNIYNQFRGKAKAAIEFLKMVRGGEAIGALHHKDIGDIDLVWGKEGTGHSDGYGLSKLVKYHPEVLDNLQEILNDMRVVSSSKNRVNLESETHKAGVRLTWDGERKSWLLTAFKKETSASDKRTDTAATSLEGDTALSQTEGSAAKIDNSSETAKKNGEKVDNEGTKFSLKDEEYLKAVEDGNMEKAQKMVNEAAEAAGYSTDSSYQGTSAFNGSAPWGNGYFLTKEERKEAWDNDEYDGDQTLGDYIHRGIDAMNLDFIALDPRNYRAADPMRKEAIDNVRNAIQKKSETITMYRSVPSDVKEGSFRNGDWVTPSRAYAVENAKVHGWGDNFNIIEQKVPVDEIWWDGNDIAEWGYGREEDYVNDTDFAYKNTKNNRKLLDAVTYDDNGNVIPLSQRFNENNSDVRYSLKDEKTMFGMHNISLDKLRKAIKQGGFAAPSMGVIDSKNGIYSGFGEITLIPKAEKIAKRTGKNIGTYAADAWTPIYPPVEKKFGGKGGDVAYDDIESVPKEMQGITRNAINGFMDGRDANSLAYLYLHEKGKAPELVHVEGKYPKELHDEVKGILGKSNGIYNTTDEQKEKLLDLFIREVYDGNREEFDNDIKNFIKKDEEFIKKRPNSDIAKNKQLDVDWMKEHGYDYGALSRFVDGIQRDIETSDKVDTNATIRAAQQYISKNGLKNDFYLWKENLNDRYQVEEVIFAGYKADGNRKYLPNTVENAVKVMKQDGKNASVGSASFSHFVASILKPMGTLDQIRKKKGNLTGNYEDVEKFQEKWQPVYDELADKMQPDAEPFESYGMDRLEEAATQKNPKKYAKDEYGVDLTDEDIDKLNELIDAVKNEKPSIYFETKFMRPYGLDEFEKAIVPNDTPSDVVDALKKAGIDVSSYERGNAEDRQKVTMDAINSSDNIRFSLKAMMEKPEGWKQANKKAIHIAEAIERDPKFSLKNLDGTLIKAGTYFSGGGLVEEGLKGIIDPVVAVEYDEKISGVYRNNFGQHIVTADVRDVDPKELVKQIDGEVEYFHASPVCKNYSKAKSNHAELELDKETAASTAEFINAIKPKVVTIENVKGYKDSEAMKTITDALDANGYTWDADVYNAADYGGYTNRERLIVRAIHDGKLPAKPEKMARKSGWYEAVADIIPTLTEKKNGVAPWMDIRLKADGIDWRNIDKPLYVMGSAYADGKIPHAFADELLPTLRTKSGDVIVMPDGKVYRAMGRVLARVSGVSDDYKMPFSESLSHTIIGNGIPTQLTEHVIAPLLTGSDPKFSIRTYHGTGAKFDKFDLSHALEGEGSETFGHGVYVTNSKEIGTDYAQRAKDKKAIFGFEFVNPQSMSKEAQDMLRHYMYKHQDVAKGLENARKDLKDVIGKFPDTDYLQELNEILAKDDDSIAIPSNRAYRYDVDIPDDNGSNYLGWNESQNFPLEKWYRLWEITHHGFNENEYFKDGGARYDIDRIERITQMKLESPENGMQKLPTLKGEELYHALEDFFDRERPSHGAELASRALSEIGFVGIKYPAGMIHGGAVEGDYNYVIFDEDNANIVGNTKFSLRGSTPYDKQMEEWMEKNHLEKGAVPMEKPIMKEGENIFDYANRMVEWTRNQNLWKTAPKQTGFQDALEKWKADNGLSPDAYPPVRPHRENYSTEIGYAEDLEEYNKKKDLWKSAPKPKDFDLSVDLEDMNKQLRNIRRAVLNQKNYDQRTVKAVSDLVRKMLNIGWGDGLSRGKVGNLLSAAKNATGANDVKKYLDKVMGILAENYLNRLSTAYDNLINTRGARADQSGVIKMGSLDAKGQAFMSEYKKAINMDDKSLNTYIANIEEDSAKNEDNVEMNDYRLAGIQAAIMFKQQIGGNDADIAELQRQIGELKNKKDATKEDKDLLKSLEKKLFENKFDRITMYENLLNNIQRMVKESKGRAKEFREEIAEHKNEILHRANLDLEGVDSTYYDTTTAKKKLVNNDLQRAVFSSTYTFEQFLKFFGKKAANGEGYLYNYFTKLNQDALDEEQLYNEMNRNALDEKTKELFGKKKFMKLVGIDGKGMKEMDIEVTDYSNKKTGKRTIHLKQGQMLYIYLVNKETDGEMKLRAMGITEEDVAAIEENLDPRVKAMGEWLQDEYLPECQRRYQATHTKYFGAPMKEVENYFPLAINNRARNVKEDVNQDSDAMSQLAGTSTGAIVTRRVNVIPLDIENADAFEVAFNHLQEMEEWSAMLPFRQDINTLLSYTHFRNQVQNMSSVAYGSGKTLWDEFKQTAQIAAGTYKPKVNAGMMDSRIAAAMGGIAVAKISGRLWTAIKQSQSATVFLPECDFTRFVKNGVNPYGSWKWAMENIPDFRKRVENMTYGDVKLRQYLDELEKWHDWTKTISKIGMAPNILVDGITCAVGARSVYETEVNRLTKLGYPKEKAEEKAYYKAVAAYNKTQQSSGGMYLSPMQVDRTYVSAALSLFKNANYAYGRMQIEACRGLARTYDFWGGKHKTTLIESMTRQIMEEDGLDENTARAIAKATYNRTFRQSIGRLINFATLVPVSWALYKVLPYLLTGDDDDKKNDMIEEAVLKGFATSLSDNYVIPFASNILNAGLKVEDGKPTFDPEVFRYQNLYINPATSDLANIYSMVGNQKWYSVANKLGMLGVQSLIGFNPETVGALYQAFAEADYDNGNTTKEWQIGILKAISAPEESIRELYMDELGLKSGDIKKIPLAELEKRYAERQINRDNLLSQIGMDAETFNGYVDKYQKSFENKIKDKMDKWDEYDKKKADEFFDTTSDPKLKDMIEKKRAKDANAAADEQIAKEGLNQEKKGKEPSEEAYDAVKMSIDVAEDNAISTYNKVLNKRYAALNDEYNEQTDAMKYIFMSKHPNFKAYKELESEYTNYGKKIKELKEKLVSADGYDAKQTILKQIRAEREKFSGLQSKVR